jgi:hypothetical protein
MGFVKGETVEWVIQDARHLLLNRLETPASEPSKKKR